MITAATESLDGYVAATARNPIFVSEVSMKQSDC